MLSQVISVPEKGRFNLIAFVCLAVLQIDIIGNELHPAREFAVNKDVSRFTMTDIIISRFALW